MTTRAVTIVNPLGMHARAAARFVRTAAAYASTIHVARGRRQMDGKSIMGLLLLSAPRGTEIVIVAEGPDEAAAVEALAQLVARGFDEETPGAEG
ncbi:MAG: HPr family phosphocarrier protein [Vicinamibacteraceae bacterium]|nr:HPr family phosphocarrier protein [Vicinamibacteraceae bacterium]